MADEHENNEQPPPHYEGGIPILPGEAERAENARRAEKEEERKYKNRQNGYSDRDFYHSRTSRRLWHCRHGGQHLSGQQCSKKCGASEACCESRIGTFEATYGEDGIAERSMAHMVSQTAAQLRSAEAAKSAADTAKDTLHVSERAYLETGARAAFFAIVLRFAGESFAALAFPPLAPRSLPSATGAAFSPHLGLLAVSRPCARLWPAPQLGRR